MIFPGNKNVPTGGFAPSTYRFLYERLLSASCESQKATADRSAVELSRAIQELKIKVFKISFKL